MRSEQPGAVCTCDEGPLGCAVDCSLFGIETRGTMKKYPIVAPPAIIEAINEIFLGDDGAIDTIEKFLPGVTKGIGKLNLETEAADVDEGFAAWNFGFDAKNGKFYVTPVQPHYVKGRKKSWAWDGKKFK